MKSNIAQYLKQVVEADLKSASPMAQYDYIWDPKLEEIMSIRFDKQSDIARTMLKFNLSLSHTARMFN